MSFLYFAYGSNLWPEQLRSRCATATAMGRASLSGWSVTYDKPGADGTAKMNLRPSSDSVALGVVYEIDDGERDLLEEAEPGYTPFETRVVLDSGTTVRAITFKFEPEGTDALPSDWYVATVLAGAGLHGLDPGYVSSHLSSTASPDDLQPGIRPAGAGDLSEMQQILRSSLASPSGRYTIHPGDLAWWMWHDDPRHAGRDSYWLVPGKTVLVIDADGPEINAFSVPGQHPIPMIEWAQRRLRGAGQVGWVADSDEVLVDYLKTRDYQPMHTDRLYHWDLDDDPIPTPDLPGGWVMRAVLGEEEADERRRASHAAFKSTMDPEAHLQRYLRFMRSPVYQRDRDLVAVAPDGRIASFIVWWPDDSGVAQIEPFGTHPEFQRKGIGRALMYYALRRMRAAGMSLARVITDEPRSDATAFYGGIGFRVVDRVRWWHQPNLGR